jgi:NAD(P)-dependent dehydrogenase (short-subunit alcohol dehydrogenase family)
VERTIVVTGGASGIGRATCERLERDGYRVLDVDLRDAAIVADLATDEGRAGLVDAVTRACGGTLDAVVANAGTAMPPEQCVRVNFFGAVATLTGLRPLLARSPAPRAVATASSSILNVDSAPLVETCLAGDEPAAVALSADAGIASYPYSKRALARWVRRHATTEAWAGAGIALNAVAPGIVDTAMTRPILADDDMGALLTAAVPMPFGGHAEPAHVAEVMAFLTSPATARLTGQVIFIDGGADVELRGDDIW